MESSTVKNYEATLEEEISTIALQQEATSGNLPPFVHVLIITSFILICLIGNSITLYIHLKNPKKYKTKAYIISLACVDVFACLTLAPMYPFVSKSAIWRPGDDLFIKIFFLLHMAVAGAYNSLLCVTALDRLIAVRFPFVYAKHYKSRTLILLSSVALFSVYSGAISAYYKNHETVYESPADSIIEIQSFIIWMMIIGFYIVIIWFLYKQGRQIRMAVGHQTEQNLGTR